MFSRFVRSGDAAAASYRYTGIWWRFQISSPTWQGHRDTIFDGHAVDRNERYHAGGAHLRVCSLVFGEINKLGSLSYTANGGFLDWLALPDQCDHAAVMVGIHFAVEQVHTGNFHGLDDRVDLSFVAAFGKIGNAFDQGGHKQEEYKLGIGEATLRRTSKRSETF